MKKQSILFLAGGLLALASCNNGAGNAGMTQAQVDSAVNAKVAEMTVQMQAKNDSLINSVAQMKADSMIAAMKGATSSTTTTTHSTTKHNTTTAPAQPAQPAQPATVGNGKPDMKGNTNNNTNAKDNKTTGNGKPSMK